MMQEMIETYGPNLAPAEFGVTLIDTHTHTFAVLTELNCNPGMSVTNAAADYINQVNNIYGLDRDTIYIEQYEGRTDLVRIIPAFNNNGQCYNTSWQPLPANIKDFLILNLKAE